VSATLDYEMRPSYPFSEYRSGFEIRTLSSSRAGDAVMDRNEIDDAVHQISMKAEVLLEAVVKLQAPETNRNVFEVSRKDGLPPLTSTSG
jgi:hypothetical protein